MNNTNKIQVFQNEAFGQVRVITKDGEPWFVGKDVAEVLGYSNTKKAINDHVKENHKLGERIVTSGQRREVIIIDEAGFYSLVLRSKLPSAEAFQEWVTSEVLPAIRKHGGYLTPSLTEEALLNPDTIIKLATALKEERAKAVKLKADKDYLSNRLETTIAPHLIKRRNRKTSNDWTITEVAELYELPRTQLFKKLKEIGWLAQVDGKGMHYPTMKVPEGSLYIEVSAYQGHPQEQVKVTNYGLKLIKQQLTVSF